MVSTPEEREAIRLAQMKRDGIEPNYAGGARIIKRARDRAIAKKQRQSARKKGAHQKGL
jgi:NOL1/NOP2/fmu family ribosome biogenesis protein